MCHEYIEHHANYEKYYTTVLCPNIKIVVADVTNTEDCKTKLNQFLPFHYLVNNAGTNVLETFCEAKPANFDKFFFSIIDVNLKSVVFLSQFVANSMIESAIKGSIVHVSSQASYISIAEHMSYSFSKAALDNLCASMCFELGPHGIRVNCVNPTVVLTELGIAHWGDPVKAAPMLSRIPLHKFAEVEDVSNAVLFLLSDGAAMISGVCLPVDGGVKAC